MPGPRRPARRSAAARRPAEQPADPSVEALKRIVSGLLDAFWGTYIPDGHLELWNTAKRAVGRGSPSRALNR